MVLKSPRIGFLLSPPLMIIFSLIIAGLLPLVAQVNQVKISPAKGNERDRFGETLAIDAHTAIVGAGNHDKAGFNAGAVYVLGRDGTYWSEIQLLTADDAAGNDRFGSAAAIDGDNLIIGAPYNDEAGRDAGAAYFFYRSNGEWIFATKVMASDGQPNQRFGDAVSISGNIAVIGAWKANGNEIGAGAFYIFKRVGTSWIEVEKHSAPDGKKGDKFARSVGISGTTIIAGAESHRTDNTLSGAAYIFQRNIGHEWELQAKLIPQNGANGDRFAASVAISGNHVIIGAANHKGEQAHAGAAYIYHWDNLQWELQAKFAPGQRTGDKFGSAVAISDQFAVVGAINESGHAAKSGAAYLYIRYDTVWTLVERLSATDGFRGDKFGYSVAVDRQFALVGAPEDDDNGANSGAIFFINNFQSGKILSNKP